MLPAARTHPGSVASSLSFEAASARCAWSVELRSSSATGATRLGRAPSSAPSCAIAPRGSGAQHSTPFGLSVIIVQPGPLVTPEETEMRVTRVRARGAMGRGGHSDDEGTPYDQRLEEVEFMRSACVAAQRGDVDKLRAMLHRRPDVCTNDGVGGDSGYTPLHYAAREGHAECVRALLASGANANARTRAGAATPLHRAAFTGSGACVQLLLKGGADPCARDADGESALHKASANGHADVVRALLRAGEERGIAGERDRKGMTPVERAADEATRAAFGD